MSTANVFWPDKALSDYRASAGQFKKNIWNAVYDTTTSNPISLVIVVLMLGGFSLGMLFSKQYPPGAYLGMGIFFLILIQDWLTRRLMVKAPVWRKIPLYTIKETWPLLDTNHPIVGAIAAERCRYPEAEFEVEYLSWPAQKKTQTLPKDFILWMYPSWLNLTDKQAALVVQDSKPVDPAI